MKWPHWICYSICCVILFATGTIRQVCGQVPLGFFTNVTKLGPNVNAVGAEDTLQAISPDGLTIVFTSFREGGFGGADLYQATRLSIADPFGPATNLGGDINTSGFDNFPSLSPDLLTLYFASTRTGNFDLYQATRLTDEEPFGNVTSLGPGVNSTAVERSPYVTPDGLSLYFSSNRSGGEGGEDIYVAVRDDLSAPFTGATNLGPGINGRTGEYGPSISSDGLFMFFSDFWRPPFRPNGEGDSDLWVATRETSDSTFGNAINLNAFSMGSVVNREFRENAPFLSGDWPASGSRLYFSSQPDGDLDIWQATWVAADCSGDGTVSANDLDCASIARDAELGNRLLSATNSIAGDVDGNAMVDFADFLILSSNFGQQGLFADGDLDFDGTVQFPDFLILSSNFGQSEGSQLESVPEPIVDVLFGLAFVAALRWRALFRASPRVVPKGL